MADIAANREAAKVKVRRAIARRTDDPAERKRMFAALKTDQWASDPFLARQMRKHWKRGRNHTHDQIVVRADQYNTMVDGRGRLWLSRSRTRAPQDDQDPAVHDGRADGHAAADPARRSSRGALPDRRRRRCASSQRPCGEATVGVDKGYTEALTDSDGHPHGTRLGVLLTTESDRLKERNRRRAKLRSIANTAAQRGDHAKAHRIKVNNLGTVKRDRQAARHRARVRTEIFTAVHEVVDKAATIVAEDLTKRFAGRKKLGKNINRRLAAWTKGVTAEALEERVGAQRFCARSRQRRLHLTNLSPLRRLRPPQRGPVSLHSVRGGVAGRRERRDQHPAQSQRPRHRPAHPTPAGEADPAGPDRSPPDQTAGPGLQPGHHGRAESETSEPLNNEQHSRKQTPAVIRTHNAGSLRADGRRHDGDARRVGGPPARPRRCHLRRPARRLRRRPGGLPRGGRARAAQRVLRQGHRRGDPPPRGQREPRAADRRGRGHRERAGGALRGGAAAAAGGRPDRGRRRHPAQVPLPGPAPRAARRRRCGCARGPTSSPAPC